ncbi:MAG: hypothetical protein INQ03_08425 [Candidatus Heimdallarchaeota archaeon]|nr:hypothetical protein [Candidatus Heimdallarchaeota archaeon]
MLGIIDESDDIEEIIKKIIQILKDGSEYTEEYIRDKLDVNFNIVRKALYKLHDQEIAVFRRERDKDTQWFHFYWRIPDYTKYNN